VPGDHRDERRLVTLIRVPDTALIVTDMLNPYEHEDADALAESVREALPAIVALRDRAAADDDTLLVYVNDNYEEWASEREDLIRRALEGRFPDLVEPIAPRSPVHFLTKGRHSIFYETPLEHLLRTSDVRRIVLCGQVTEQCILYSALDGYLRGFEIVVPRDAVAHIDPRLADAALEMMQRNMHADLTSADGKGPLGPASQDA
jgi:nicotinamidase-related amidase